MDVTMKELLVAMIDEGGSDLHIRAYMPPELRVHGELLPLADEELAEEESFNLCREIASEEQMAEVEKNGGADFAIAFIQAPNSGAGYSADDAKRGGNGYIPISLQYNDYTATYARATSIAGGDPLENFSNRTYKGKSVKTSNKDDLKMVVDTKAKMGQKPVIVVLNTGKPVVPAEFEGKADAILISFGIQNQAIFDIISGKAEPSGLLPMQMPADMKTVEQQNEDVPRDMVCYKDADGNLYDFGFGLNWSGVINDARVQAYK